MNKLLTYIRKLRDPHIPLVGVYINEDQLRENYRTLTTAALIPIAPVLKSNAYGHGLITIAKILEPEKPPFFIVDSFYEAQSIRHSGVMTSLLIIGYTLNANILTNRMENISFMILSIESLRELSNTIKKPTTIHLKIDTGMHRHGIMPLEVDIALTIIQSNKHIVLDGICTHFADAESDVPFTNLQQTKWDTAITAIKKRFPNIKYIHSQNSAGIAGNFNTHATVARSGLALYGFSPITTIKPILTLKTIIDNIQTVEPGESIGYSRTFIASKLMKIATIPVGYYEGIDRRLSNNGFIEIHNVMCPIIGRVSMNITTIDITNVLNANIGDEVIVFSSENTKENSLKTSATRINTIIYELLVHIPATLRRIVH